MIPTFNDLANIASAITEIDIAKYFDSGAIVFNCNQEMINKINEDIFYRNNKEGSPEKDPDEVDVVIQGILFKFIKE